MSTKLIMAVPKGRILDELMPILAEIGITPEKAFSDNSSRKLRFATNHDGLDLIRVRAFDVATFVAHGAAQIGIVGSDVLEEFDYMELFAPLDLDIGHCRLSLACPEKMPDDLPTASHIRVSTKYPKLTQRFCTEKGVQAECIKLNGAMEIAPSLHLTDYIVDLVSSGKTLKENGLKEIDTILSVSSKFIVNRSASKTRYRDLKTWLDKFKALERNG